MKNLFITENTTIKETLKKLDETAEKILIVVEDDNRLLGVITDGDIRRAILASRSLGESIRDVYNNSPIYFKESEFDYNDIKKIFLENKINLAPVVNNETRVIDFVSWEKVFSDNNNNVISQKKINIPVVIMAGGKGSRLDPFTKILPKPLIPVGEKPILEIIMDNFLKFGASEFHITLNYKGEMVKAYFNDGQTKYKIKFISEDTFLGTAGSLKLLPDNISETFIVTNCDIIVNTDYYDVVKFHKKNNNTLTILGSIQHYVIPYGVIQFREEGIVEKITEKPEYDLTINTGIYIMNTEVLDFIPEKVIFHVTDLIDILIKNNLKVGIYPVSEKSYIDIGQWEEYKNAVGLLKI